MCSRGLGHQVPRPAAAESPENPFQGLFLAPPQGPSAREGLGAACPAFKAFCAPEGARGPPASRLVGRRGNPPQRQVAKRSWRVRTAQAHGSHRLPEETPGPFRTNSRPFSLLSPPAPEAYAKGRRSGGSQPNPKSTLANGYWGVSGQNQRCRKIHGHSLNRL